ncbi:MAG: hypothetical protein IID09_05570 [Candidatus Hydrogenedentes bacterium]|nr:hypothetical protein [Candidatus Hydrogenedentota bacterium]
MQVRVSPQVGALLDEAGAIRVRRIDRSYRETTPALRAGRAAYRRTYSGAGASGFRKNAALPIEEITQEERTRLSNLLDRFATKS